MATNATTINSVNSDRPKSIDTKLKKKVKPAADALRRRVKTSRVNMMKMVFFFVVADSLAEHKHNQVRTRLVVTNGSIFNSNS